MSARDSLTDYHGWTLALTAYSYGGGEPKYFSPWPREVGIALICAAIRYHACRVGMPAGEYRGYYWREADA